MMKNWIVFATLLGFARQTSVESSLVRRHKSLYEDYLERPLFSEDTPETSTVPQLLKVDILEPVYPDEEGYEQFLGPAIGFEGIDPAEKGLSPEDLFGYPMTSEECAADRDKLDHVYSGSEKFRDAVAVVHDRALARVYSSVPEEPAHDYVCGWKFDIYQDSIVSLVTGRDFILKGECLTYLDTVTGFSEVEQKPQRQRSSKARTVRFKTSSNHVGFAFSGDAASDSRGFNCTVVPVEPMKARHSPGYASVRRFGPSIPSASFTKTVVTATMVPVTDHHTRLRQRPKQDPVL